MAVTAIVLAGGAAHRLGGAAKPFLSVGGRPLISQVLDACRSVGCDSLIVVGPQPPSALAAEFGGAELRWTREEPAGGGPAAAVAAGLRVIDPAPADLTLLLAADAPWVSGSLVDLVAAAHDTVRGGGDGAWAVSAGVRQPLLACVRVSALFELSLGAGGSLYSALAGLTLTELPVGATSVADADTWDDLIALRREVAMADKSAGTGQASLSEWVRAAAEVAGVPAEKVDVDAVLDLAREAAHNVQRPAAPLTTFLLGYAAGAGGLDPARTASLAEELSALARSQTPES